MARRPQVDEGELSFPKTTCGETCADLRLSLFAVSKAMIFRISVRKAARRATTAVDRMDSELATLLKGHP